MKKDTYGEVYIITRYLRNILEKVDPEEATKFEKALEMSCDSSQKKEKRKKKEVIVCADGLTKEQRMNFSKEHPGQRLSFMLRFPNAPLVISIIVLFVEILRLLYPI